MEADATVIYYNEKEFGAAGVPFPHDELDVEPDAGRRQEARGRCRVVSRSSGGRRRAQLAGCLRPDHQGLRRECVRAELGRASAPRPR